MPDIFDLVARWWKRMLVVIILSLLTVGIITFLKPQQYLSVTTAVPASSFASDKAKIFNENIQELYSTLGTPDDLDMILGTANLDTVYLFVTDQFNLFDHYKTKEQGDAARTRAAILLKKNTKVMKSEYGELKVKVWDTDKDLAPQLANAIMNRLQAIHARLQSAGNESTLIGLQNRKKKIQLQLDSLTGNAETITERRKDLQEQTKQYEKLINEYQLMVDSKPPVLIVVEEAKPPNWPDRPRRIQILVATAVLSFLFALLAALILERRKTS
jgi:peptidoglycan hydrolase CwlO-like protein